MKVMKQLELTRKASRSLNLLDVDKINSILLDVADAAIACTSDILAENQKDLARMEATDPKYDRLKLTADRIAAIAADIRNVASLPSPLGRVLSETVRPNGMRIKKVAVRNNFV